MPRRLREAVKWTADSTRRAFNALDESLSKNLPWGKVKDGDLLSRAVWERAAPAAIRRRFASYAASKGNSSLAEGIIGTIKAGSIRGIGLAAGFVRPPATKEQRKEVGKAIHGEGYGEPL